MSQYPVSPLELANKLQSLCGLIERSLYSIAREVKESDQAKYEDIRQLGKTFNLKSTDSISVPDAFDKYDEAYEVLEKLKRMHKSQIRGKNADNLCRYSIKKTIQYIK